jgi:pyrimidine-nucleoside phosphorylase
LTFEELIERKRDGREHSAAELERIVFDFTSGRMPEYQMSAWLMAVYLNGMSPDETVAMTDAMVRSGVVIDLSTVPGVKVDKHSTGGVADTTTLVLAPLVAACGVPVAKMSGRGLGHTGGTLDKLESIPGFRVDLGVDEFVAQVRKHGIAVISQSPDVDPADKRIYALRDVTATVPSIPLIVGSIISKKVAGGADAIVLDVKVGSGAFMKTREHAAELGAELVRVGRALGKEVSVVMTDMNQPLGMAVGNALEVREAIDVLAGRVKGPLSELCVVFAARMLQAGRVAADEEAGRKLAEDSLASGRALAKFAEWVEAQGGDPGVAEEPELLHLSARTFTVKAEEGGYVTGFDAEQVGRSAMLLGAGRMAKDDAIDHGAGLQLAVRIGDRVEAGSELCTMYAASDELFGPAAEHFRTAVRLGDSPVAPPPLFYGA